MGKIRTRETVEVRREQILTAAVGIAIEQGYGALSRNGVAKRAGVADGLVNHIFSTMPQLKRAVIRYALYKIENGDSRIEYLSIIAQGLAQGEAAAKKAPEHIQRAALETLI